MFGLTKICWGAVTITFVFQFNNNIFLKKDPMLYISLSPELIICIICC